MKTTDWTFAVPLELVDVERALQEAASLNLKAVEITVKTPFCGEKRAVYCAVPLYDAIYKTLGQKSWPKIYAQKAYTVEAKTVQFLGYVIADWVMLVDSCDNPLPLEDFLKDYQEAKKIWDTPVWVVVKGFELAGPPKNSYSNLDNND
jgi:hypothetical protein